MASETLREDDIREARLGEERRSPVGLAEERGVQFAD
jgi:hypothetical protein